jgi:hypothetical protein
VPSSPVVGDPPPAGEPGGLGDTVPGAAGLGVVDREPEEAPGGAWDGVPGDEAAVEQAEDSNAATHPATTDRVRPGRLPCTRPG